MVGQVPAHSPAGQSGIGSRDEFRPVAIVVIHPTPGGVLLEDGKILGGRKFGGDVGMGGGTKFRAAVGGWFPPAIGTVGIVDNAGSDLVGNRGPEHSGSI